jgi:hypothetical protein
MSASAKKMICKLGDTGLIPGQGPQRVCEQGLERMDALSESEGHDEEERALMSLVFHFNSSATGELQRRPLPSFCAGQ